jgi:uncharacterized membrane protein
MSKPVYRDLLLIIILAIASLAFLSVPALDQSPLNIIPQIIILLFLPGYALVAVIDPQFNRSPIIKKAVFSFTVSLVLTIVSVYPPVKFSNYVILVVLTLILSIFALVRRRVFFGRMRLPVEEKAEDKTYERDKLSQITVSGPKDSQKRKQYSSTPERRFYPDIILVVILTLLCALFVLEPTLNKTVIRTVLGLLLILFLPGYALITSLFPKRDDLDTIERLALIFGLSIAITPLIGLALNYTPFGIRLDPILASLTGVTLLLSAVAYLRRMKTAEEDRFRVDFGGFFRGLMEGFQGESKTGKILSVILILSIVLAIATTAYIIVKPKEGESFTEFYILGSGGKASDYPTNLTADQEGNVIIGIVNHENKKTSYQLVVTSNNTVLKEQTVTLADGEKMEIPFNFTAGAPGERKLEFLLYKLPDNNNIYRSLHLWLNITGSSNETVV